MTAYDKMSAEQLAATLAKLGDKPASRKETRGNAVDAWITQFMVRPGSTRTVTMGDLYTHFRENGFSTGGQEGEPPDGATWFAWFMRERGFPPDPLVPMVATSAIFFRKWRAARKKDRK